jgi:phytoene dehydrogenase-like protein
MATVSDVDAVVVGSGPNGLAGALVLAEAGLRVTVLEAATRVGGGLRTEELTLPGFRHDVCSTVQALAQAALAFRAFDLAAEGLSYAHPGLPLGHPLDGGDAVLVHRDLEQTIDGLGRDGAAWRRTVGHVVAGGAELVDGLLDPLRVPPQHPFAMAGFGARGVWPAQVLNRVAFREPRTRALFSGIAAHAVLPLSSPATAGYGLMLASLAHAVGWPVAVGGSQAVADAMVGRLQRLGGEVVTSHRVSRLSEIPSGRVVLLDVTPRQFLAMADDDLPARYARALRRFRYGPGVFKVDWALDGPVPWSNPGLAEAGTVHLGGSADEIATSERIVARGRHADRPYVLFVQASVADATRAPEGKQTGWAYCHVPNGSTVDMTEAIEAQVERFAPGFRDRILGRHAMGPAALEAHNANEVGGDINGGSAVLHQFVARPVASRNPWATPVPGTYLCSSSTPPGGGVHGMGGWHAAHRALRWLNR